MRPTPSWKMRFSREAGGEDPTEEASPAHAPGQAVPFPHTLGSCLCVSGLSLPGLAFLLGYGLEDEGKRVHN